MKRTTDLGVARRAVLVVTVWLATCVAALPNAQAADPPPPVVTSTSTFANGSGELVQWFSADGTTEVATHLGATGQVVSVERIAFSLSYKDVYGVRQGTLTRTITVVFPSEREWTETTDSSACDPCEDDAWLYAAPSLIRRLEANKQLFVVNGPTSIDGRNVVEVAATSGYPHAWIDPANDEIVLMQNAASAPLTAYTWWRGTQANDAQLSLKVPAGYRRLQKSYVPNGLSPVPPA